MFESMVMMKLFGLKVFWLIESRRTGRAGHVTRKRGKRKAYRVLAGNPEDHLKDLGINASLILRWM